MRLKLALGMMAEATSEAELAECAPIAAALPEEEKDIARWAYAYALAEFRQQQPREAS